MLQKLNIMVRTLDSSDEHMATPLPWLSLYRTGRNELQMPKTDLPYIYFVLDGSMRLHTPSGILDYVAGQYSVSAIDTPSRGQVLSFSKEEDFLALSVEFSLSDVHEVIMELDGSLAEQIIDGSVSADVMERSDAQVFHAVLSLLTVLDDEVQRGFMGNHIRREIIFHILCGSSGKQFLQSMIQIQQSGEIYELNSWIKENYRQPFSVEELAGKWNMSVPVLHQKFKSAVGMGLLQCQKRLRLTEARRLMLDENRNVTEAAFEVGYESLSQFTREYKRMFGAAPKEDTALLKKQLNKASNFSED